MLVCATEYCGPISSFDLFILLLAPQDSHTRSRQSNRIYCNCQRDDTDWEKPGVNKKKQTYNLFAAFETIEHTILLSRLDD